MTTSRIVRGTKARIFLYIFGVLFVIATIACYKSKLTELDDVKKSSDLCHQLEENLSTQLQVISDYKQRLEKSLKTEKADHKKTKDELELKLDEAALKSGKDITDLNIRLASVNQHFQLFKTEHDDFKEECSKNQKKQLAEINQLQAKLKEVQEELKKVNNSKENIKTEYLEMQKDKEAMEKEFRLKSDAQKENEQLKYEIEGLRSKCGERFAEQVAVAPDVYQIQAKPPNSPEKSVTSLQFMKVPSKSTTSSSFSPNASKPSLNNALPLILPTVTPSSGLKVDKDENVPRGVVPIPGNFENVLSNIGAKRVDDGDNNAREVFDHNLQNRDNDAVGFGDLGARDGKDMQHIDHLRVGANHYNDLDKDNQNEIQDENAEDDDPDYGNQGRIKEPVIRN